MFEIYDVIRPLHAPQVEPSAPFHVAHADLSVANVMVDPESGEITGLIDWGMAGCGFARHQERGSMTVRAGLWWRTTRTGRMGTERTRR